MTMHQRNPEFSPREPYVRQPETIIAERSQKIERKMYHLHLCENARGQFLRVVEEHSHSRKSSHIIIPGPGIADFIAALTSVAFTDKRNEAAK